MPLDWNAESYAALSLPHEEWGIRTLARLGLQGDERVLDAGCGTGRDTERILEELPDGSVVALDGSPRMLDELTRRLGERMSRVVTVEADLTAPLPLAEPVDCVFSVAAFHWVPDHDVLFANLAEVLRSGGRIAAECGGAGNIAGVNRALAEVLGRTVDLWEFADAGETRDRLRRAGFVDAVASLRPAPFRIDSGEVRDYFATVVLGGHLAELPPSDHESFVAVIGRLAEPVVDYVRLELSATRA